MKRLILPLLLLALLAPIAKAQSTIFIVRHAEKVDATANPDLSEAGRARAESLAKMLKDARITVIYATEFKRTQQTAAPLAKLLGLKEKIVPGKNVASLAAELLDSKANALVVGHHNTVPDLIKALGVTTPINLTERNYDYLFVVVLDGKPRLIRLHYR
jgi:phosphohistidine phosphatase SixA